MADPIADLAKGVAEQLPIKEAYNDALSPGLKQVGGAVEDIAKTLRIALLPLEAAGALYDRISKLIDRSLRNVPEAQRIAPAPQILGPVVEGLRYEELGTPVSDMFAELLAKAFNKDEAGRAHPSYPNFIRQLSSDEAKLLQLLWKSHVDGQSYRRRYTMDWVANTARFINKKVELDETPAQSMSFPENISFYIENLYSMGLAGIYKDNETPITDNQRQIGTRIEETLRLTPLGIRFMDAVKVTM